MAGRDYLRHIPVLRRLNQCPFCGGNAFVTPYYNVNDDIIYMIRCVDSSCQAVVQFEGADTEEMIRRWNHRNMT